MAKTLELTIRDSDWFNRQGGGGIARQPKVIDSAFSEDVRKRGLNSEPLELGPGHVVMLRMKEHQEATPRTLEESREEIVKILREQQAPYMLSLDKGALTFMEAQDIEGDSAPKRRKPEEWSGMLRCRLLSETNAVLAEQLLPAPDHLCAVLDPKSGSDKPVQYTAAGPVVFQVRLPRVKGATRLDIIRIIQPGEPPLEGLLGSIPLPKS